MRTRILQHIFVLAAISGSVFAEVPPLINYQGTLANEDGILIAENGVERHRLSFRIYATADATEPVWGPQTFDDVLVVDGRFNVILGSTDVSGTAITDAFDGSERYLGIKVDDDAEIAPRQRILSAPYALHAASAVQAEYATHGVPAGAVMAFNLSTCPEGWSEYLPARGRFVRGIDATGINDPEGVRAPGSLQDGALQSHSHTLSNLGLCVGCSNGGPHSPLSWAPSDTATGDVHDQADRATETRPKNVALLYCEKT